MLHSGIDVKDFAAYNIINSSQSNQLQLAY